MKSQLTWNTVHHLEQCLEPSIDQTIQTRHDWKTKLNELWQVVIGYLAASNEPHVWKSQDNQGNILWNAYDPITGQTINKVSAPEIRIWLEERYY